MKSYSLLCFCAVLLAMIVIAASAVIMCVTVVCIGCFCLRRYVNCIRWCEHVGIWKRKF